MAVSTQVENLTEIRGRAIRAWGKGRVCAEAECTTVLSVYNDGDKCAQHSFAPVVTRAPGARRK